MDRRALLTLVGCGVGVVATGRGAARAACGNDAATPAWVFPAGEYRIGIDSSGDRPARLIVSASESLPERSFTVPAVAHDRRIGAWFSLASNAVATATATADAAAPLVPDAATTSPAGSPAVADASDAEVRLVFQPQPGVSTYVECAGIGAGGHAFVAATVLGTGPTFLVRLDPASGDMTAAVISRRPRSVLAIYRRASQNAIRVVVEGGAELEVRAGFA